ncbi:MAG: hypothetical protein KatS3mg017_0592 [Fimbriimonadales bacterium]|nr:MAG: hypothetical protein KatS3mg017_0592 [Fimbriimonadales bacterium]
MRFWNLCLLWVFLQGIALGQAVDLSQEPALQKPLSLRFIMRPLREVIEHVAAQTGATLGVAKTIEHYKVTLIVREQPAWQILHMLTRVYPVEWRVEENDRYYLTEIAETRNQRLRQQQAQRQALQRALDAQIQRLQQAAQTDFLTLRQQLQSIDAEINRLAEQRPPDWADQAERLAQQRARIGRAGESLLCYLLGVIAQAWTPEQRLRLWNGQVLLASTKPLAGAQPMPANALQWIRAWSPAFDEQPPESAQMLIRLESDSKQLVLALVARMGESTVSFIERLPLEFSDSGSPPTPTTLPEAVGRISLRRTAEAPLPTAPYWGNQFTLAEILAWLADHTDLNIVADAFRVPMPCVEERARAATTVADWLQDVLQTNAVLFESPAHSWLIARHREQAELIPSEIDEPTLERFEKRASNGLSLDDYAELAALLTPAQQRRLEIPTGYALRFDTAPLQNSIPALRFWASLTPTQRQAANERLPLAYPQLSAIQQRLFWDAIEYALLNPTINSGDLVQRLEQLYDPQTHSELAFFTEQWKNAHFVIRSDAVTLTFEDVESYEQTLRELREQGLSVSTEQSSNTQRSLYFGYGTSSAAVYIIDLRVPTP